MSQGNSRTEARSYKCIEPNCTSLGFNLTRNLLSHLKTVHKLPSKAIIAKYNSFDFLQCHICDQVCVKVSGLNRHKVSAHSYSDTQSDSSQMVPVSDIMTKANLERKRTKKINEKNSSKSVLIKTPILASEMTPKSPRNFQKTNFTHRSGTTYASAAASNVTKDVPREIPQVPENIEKSKSVVTSKSSYNIKNNINYGRNVPGPSLPVEDSEDEDFVPVNKKNSSSVNVVTSNINIIPKNSTNSSYNIKNNINYGRNVPGPSLPEEDSDDEDFVPVKNKKNSRSTNVSSSKTSPYNLRANQYKPNKNSSNSKNNINNARIIPSPTIQEEEEEKEEEETRTYLPSTTIEEVNPEIDRAYCLPEYIPSVRKFSSLSHILDVLRTIFGIIFESLNTKMQRKQYNMLYEDDLIHALMFVLNQSQLKIAYKDKVYENLSNAARSKSIINIVETVENLCIYFINVEKVLSVSTPNSEVNENAADSSKIKKVVKKAKSLIARGSPGKVHNTLKNYLESEISYEANVINELCNLHPQSKVASLPIFNAKSPERDIDATFIDTILVSLPKNSATGPSGFSYELIQLLARDNNCKQQLVDFVNNVYFGNMYASSSLLNSRLIPIVNKKNKKVRPIAIGEALMRFANKAISRFVKQDVIQDLAPIQLGYGTKSGVEIIVHSIQNFVEKIISVEEDLIIHAVDISNAFNSISRKAIFNSLNNHIPPLVPCFKSLYGSPTDLIINSVNKIKSSSGVRQGDPLAGLFFCYGIQPILKVVNSSFPNVEIKAYFDDIYLFGNRDQVSLALALLKKELAKIDLKVNESKSKTYYKQLFLDNVPFKPLNSIIGSNNCVMENLEELFAEWLAPLKHFSEHFNAKETLCILKSSLIHIPIYWARTTKPIEGMFKLLDTRINEIIAKALDLTGNFFNKRTLTLLSIPTKNGGMGIPNFNNIHKLCWSASFANLCEFNRNFNLNPPFEILLNLMDFFNPNRDPQKVLCDGYNNKVLKELIEREVDPIVKNWIMASNNKLSSLWIYDSKTNFDERNFKTAIKLKLFIDIIPLENNQKLTCICNQFQGDQFKTFVHGFSCNVFSQIKTSRHYELVKRFNTLLKSKKFFGNSDTWLEPKFHVRDLNGAEKEVKADIKWKSHFNHYYFAEFSITSKIDKLHEVERQKLLKFDRRVEVFKPLVIICDNVGSLSNETLKSLDTIKENLLPYEDGSLTMFHYAISSTLWLFNSFFINALLSNPVAIHDGSGNQQGV